MATVSRKMNTSLTGDKLYVSSIISIFIYNNRHPGIFNCILNFYRTGRLHIMDDLCVLDYAEDLDYWGVDPIWLELCCENKYASRSDSFVSLSLTLHCEFFRGLNMNSYCSLKFLICQHSVCQTGTDDILYILYYQLQAQISSSTNVNSLYC